MMSLQEAQALVPGSRLVGDPAVRVQRVHSDTRSLRTGDLFVALKGERFDAHDFLAQARTAGAVAALASHGLADAGLAGLEVADTRVALGELAQAWRARFTLPLIAVTGSNGKTTVTQMIASILRAWVGAAAHATQGNLNNDIGVPLTLLGLRPTHRAAVIELGMNHPGEIAGLAAQAAPTVAVVNNAQREHQEFMHTVDAVARENGSVLAALAGDGVAVFPSDAPYDRYAPIWFAQAGTRRALRFATEADAEVRGHADWLGEGFDLHLSTPAGTARTRLAMAGTHNVRNALAACAATLAAGCPLDAVVQGLASFEPVKGRSQLKHYERAGQRIALIDDSYNANPDSVRAAIDVLAALPGPRWLVLGDMGEVGDQGPAFHAEVGAYAMAQGVEACWCAGVLAAHTAAAYGSGARHFVDAPTLIAALGEAPMAASVLVKGSRFMGMERVVTALGASAVKDVAS